MNVCQGLRTSHKSAAGRTPTVAGAALIVLLILILFPGSATARADADRARPAASDLTELSLEDLLNVKLTLASGKSENLSQATAAVNVITQEDSRRSGLTSIPELLRVVPGMQVGHVDASEWAISARGSNEVFANKLLVLGDGRSVYNPPFIGVYLKPAWGF